MSFLDEGTFVGKNAVADALKDPEFKALKSDEKAKAIATLKQGGSITTEKKGKDLDGDGDIDSDDYLAARDAAIKKAKAKIKEMAKNLGYSKDPETGKIISMSSNDAIQNWLNKIKQDLENEDNLDEIKTKGIEKFLRGKSYKTPYSDFVASISSKDNYDNDVNSNDIKKSVLKLTKLKKGELSQDEFEAFIKELKKNGYDDDEIEKLEKSYEDAIKAKREKVDESTTLNEAFSPEEVLLLNSLLLLGSGLIGAARVGLVPPNPIKIIRRFLQQRKFNQIYKRLKTDPEIIATAKKYPNGGREWVKYINSKLTDEEKKNLNLVFNRGTLRDKLSDMKESTKTIELPADTTFTLDLKHLMKKHLDEGKSQEDVVKLTKALMKKLHDKGEIKVDGTKVTFVKEADIPQDTQLALPEPDAPDFLGDDGVDYEGGMAKSQMLKMKKYAAALCDMIEDESQLEAWVQAKLTKASDYMSAVYHYLDYQQSKMNEGFELNNRKVVDLEGEADGEDSYITAAYYSDTGKPLSDDEIEDLVNKYPADLNPGGAWWEKQR